MQNITLKKIILALVVISLAIFLFKYIGIILGVILTAVSVTLVVALNWVLKILVVLGALLLLYSLFTKN
ncbi:MAG: hypothetical protein IKN85_07315 [Oscillospiraceae bacterium]|nr:hypothetical protein [Oscillospiraceae bacterium]